MFDHLLEWFYRYNSNKWTDKGFGEEIARVQSIEVHFTNLIWSAASLMFSK